jgi:hypothetical protein
MKLHVLNPECRLIVHNEFTGRRCEERAEFGESARLRRSKGAGMATGYLVPPRTPMSEGDKARLRADTLRQWSEYHHRDQEQRQARVDEIVQEQLDAERFGVWGRPTQRLRHGQPV